MAITEACKFQVKEEIDRYVEKEGFSRNEASKKVAAWFSDILGKEIKPGTIRQKDLRARQVVATNVATEDWSNCKNESNGKCEAHLPVDKVWTGKPAKHGLCKMCRQNEIEEQREQGRRKKIEAAKKEFDKIPVDNDSDKFWNDLTEEIVSCLDLEKNIPCGKVSPEVLSKIKDWRKNLNDCLDKVYSESTCPSMS